MHSPRCVRHEVKDADQAKRHEWLKYSQPKYYRELSNYSVIGNNIKLRSIAWGRGTFSGTISNGKQVLWINDCTSR